MPASINSMTTPHGPDASHVPQYGLAMILFMFAWPAAWFSFLIYVVAPMFLAADGTFPAWLEIAVNLLGHGGELCVALIIFRREGYRLTIKSLRERIRWRLPRAWWKWGAAFGAFLAAIVAVLLLLPVATHIASVLTPPSWLPDHPLIESSEPSETVRGLGTVLWAIFDIGFMSLIVTVFSEELYYRGALQPKMRKVFGRWTWVANGVLFGLKHAYVWWRLPYLVPVGVAIAYIFGTGGSLPLSVFFHWLGNTI